MFLCFMFFYVFFFMFYVIRRLHVQKTFIRIQSVKGLILVKRIFFNDFVSNLTLHMLVKMGLPYNGKAQQFSKKLYPHIQNPTAFSKVYTHNCHQMHIEHNPFRSIHLSVAVNCEHQDRLFRREVSFNIQRSLFEFLRTTS